MAFKKGDLVKVAVFAPQGPVAKMRMDDDGVIYYLIQWENADGTPGERWFTEDQLVSAE